MKQLKVVTFNLENFFYTPQAPHKYQKSLEKVESIARAIQDINPDILFAQEIGGFESLQNLNQYHLDNEYTPYLLPGNSDRGIEIGYLVHKNLSLCVEHISYRDHSIQFNYPHEINENEWATKRGHALVHGPHLFSRDVSELRLFQDEKLFLCLCGVHLKSYLDDQGVDPEGRLRREAELKALVDIYQKRKQFSDCFLLGDFNGLAAQSKHHREFEMLYQETELKDIQDVLQFPQEERATFMRAGALEQDFIDQLDYIFIPPKWHPYLVKDLSGAYRYKNNSGIPLKSPTNPYERGQMPSDHYPLVATFKLP